VAKGSSQARLREFAVVGARARLEELRREEASLRSDFPELFRGTGAPQRAASSAGKKATPPRRRRSMSAAERKAVSERMRKYWADRRKKAGPK
jgi:hypothetical protein